MREQLPLGVDPETGESFGSVCLRSLRPFDLNMHWLRRVLGLSYSAHPTRDDALSLAYLLQASPTWFTRELPSRATGNPFSCDYGGQRFLAPAHLKFRNPQICPACVHARGYCLKVWDLSLFTVCPIHERPLVDGCRRCERPLSWNRPAIDVCSCGRAFSAPPSEQVSGAESFIAGAIDAHMCGNPFLPTSFEGHGLPGLLADLSLNALLFALQAFGEVAGPHQRTPPAATTKARDSACWREILSRACTRLSLMGDGQKDFELLSSVVSEVILTRVSRHSLKTADTQVGKVLSRSVFGRGKELPTSDQMELFQ